MKFNDSKYEGIQDNVIPACLESDTKDSGVASRPRMTDANKINESDVIPTLPTAGRFISGYSNRI